MNFIVNGFHNETYFPVVSKILKHFNVKHCYLTYSESKAITPSKKIKVEFFDIKDLTVGNYNVDWQEITPLDEIVIEKMTACESVVLKMMDRLPYKLSYDERKTLYLTHLRYWNHVLNVDKIDLFLSSSPPHEVYDYIIYSMCKLKNITTLYLAQTCISDTITLVKDWESSVVNIQDIYKKLQKKYKNTDLSDIVLTGRFKKDFTRNTSKKDPLRFEMLKKRPSHNVIKNIFSLAGNLKISRYLQLLKNPDNLTKAIETYIFGFITEKKLSVFYRKNSIEPDLTKKFIYFPLHMQPESSTSPMAGAFVNQALIVQMLAYHLPKDVFIYIKENPYQTHNGRSMEFYKELLSIPQVRFVPISFNTYKLTNYSIAVATATGTAGLEALYRCKPVFMFGHNFYQYANGVFRIKTNRDCKYAIEKVVKDGYRPNLKGIKIYLKALEQVTIEGYIDVDYKKDTHVTDTLSNLNILKKLITEIKIICDS